MKSRIFNLSALLLLVCVYTHAQDKTNLVAHWRLNNNVSDGSVNAINGTIVGSAPFTTDMKEGSHAMTFNGTTQYVDFGNPSTLPAGTSAKSISAWAKTTSTAATAAIVSFGSPTTSNALYLGQSGTQLVGGGFGNNVTYSSFWTAGVWQHICLTYDGTNGRLYVNGTLVNTQAKSWNLILSKVYIGQNVNGTNKWSGTIDDVRIYNKALSAAEVQALAGQAPSVPTGLTATPASPTSVNLGWTDASNNESGFIVERSTNSGGPFTLLTTTAANATAFTDATATAATTYYYRIAAVNFSDNSAYTAVSTATTPGITPNPPTGLSASVASSTSINLNWTDASNNETGFQIERSVTSGSGFILIATTAANTSSYSDAGLSAGTTYYYRIRSINAGGNSTYTTEATATTLPTAPVVPSGLNAVAASSSSVGLTWTDASNNETGFQIERSLTSGTGFVLITTTAANSTSFSDTGLNAGTTYFYRIRSTNAGGNSAYTTEATATTLPTAPLAPMGLTATPVSSSTINLNWTDASNNETGFQVERSNTSGGGFVLITTTAANTSSFADTGLSPGTPYYYRIRSVNSGGNSAYTTEVTATTILTAPLPPTGLTASPVSTSAINLSWTDASSNESGFQVERSLTTETGFTLLTTTAPNVTSFSDVGLSEGITYYYRIRAVNAGGNSAYSSETSMTTLLSIPTAPTGLTAVTVSSTSINLGWTDASNNETGFQLERSTVAGSSFSIIATTLANVVSFSDVGLTPGTTYYYRISAVNASENSPYTAVVSATTQAPVIIAPTALTVSTVTSTSITLNWTDASSNETGFLIERSFTSGSGFVQIAATTANAVSYSDAGRTPNTSYFYRIRATNGSVTSAYTVEVTATTPQPVPTVPGNLTAAAASSTSVNLSWADNSSNELEFEIERSLSADNGFNLLVAVTANATTYSDLNLTSGNTYYYRIRATNGGGASAYTSIVNVKLPVEGANPACENIFCDNAGGVGIGTPYVPAGYKLAVNGKIMAEGVKVLLRAEWPDYVFGKDYQLKEIPELKKFIDDNGHLPNVPSAQTVEKEGIELGEINAVLLEKIEELSLYLIQMEERMKKLEEENDALKKKAKGNKTKK